MTAARHHCADCLYYEYGRQDCRRHAPECDRMEARYPHVSYNGWCGDWEQNAEVDAVEEEPK
jgi:hypothetical protein